MPDHACDAQAALGLGLGLAVLAVEVAAVEVRVGHDRAARDFVESDVLRREIGRTGDDDRVAYPLRVLQCPAQGLHAAQAAAHDCGQALDAQAVQQACLGIHPVFDRDHGKAGAVHTATVGVHMHRAGGAKTRSQVVHADHKKAVCVQRFARSDHAVPPAIRFVLACIQASEVVGGIERMQHQYGIGILRIQHTIGFVTEVIRPDRSTTAQRQRLGKKHR